MQKDRKKIHQKIVKEMRNFNKRLAADEYLGLNRFRIDMVSENMYRYSDGSSLYLLVIYKISDKLTGNSACFIAYNYDFYYKIYDYANDFLIRCSSGRRGHAPSLHYVAYDVHQIIPYTGRKIENNKIEDGIINTYNWLGFDVFTKKEVIK